MEAAAGPSPRRPPTPPPQSAAFLAPRPAPRPWGLPPEPRTHCRQRVPPGVAFPEPSLGNPLPSGVALTARSAHNASVKCDRMRSQKPRRRPDSCHAFHPEVGAPGGRRVGLVLTRKPQLCDRARVPRGRSGTRPHVKTLTHRESHVSQSLGLQVPMLSVPTTGGDRPLLRPRHAAGPRAGCLGHGVISAIQRCSQSDGCPEVLLRG